LIDEVFLKNKKYWKRNMGRSGRRSTGGGRGEEREGNKRVGQKQKQKVTMKERRKENKKNE